MIAYWIVALSLFPIILIGSIYKVRTQPEKANSIIYSAIGAGFLLVLSYTSYAYFFFLVSPLDVILAKSEPDLVKNIWGQKNMFYSVPLGYMFISCGLIVSLVHYGFRR